MKNKFWSVFLLSLCAAFVMGSGSNAFANAEYEKKKKEHMMMCEKHVEGIVKHCRHHATMEDKKIMERIKMIEKELHMLIRDMHKAEKEKNKKALKGLKHKAGDLMHEKMKLEHERGEMHKRAAMCEHKGHEIMHACMK